MNILSGKTSKVEAVVLVNQNVAKYEHLDGKTLCDLDDLTDFGVHESNDIENLFIKTAQGTLLIPFSKGIDTTQIFEDEIVTGGMFRVRNKKAVGDEEGVFSGARYISFGKPAGIVLNVVSSYVTESTVAQGA